jgi:hypothetical protein
LAFAPDLLLSYAPDPGLYHCDTCPDWVDELDLAVTGAHVRMGTHALNMNNWLMADHHEHDELALRRRLLAEQRTHVFACTEHAGAAASEAADLVGSWVKSHRGLDMAETGATHPLMRAGASIQEDLCLMVRRGGQWHLEGAVLCFPSLWVLADKIGKPTALVHQPVPYYAEELSRRVDTFFDRLSPDKPVWRRNFSVWPTLLLWAPSLEPSLCPTEATVDGTPTSWLRSERQTLRRLPGTGALLFTIRVQTVPLSVLAQRPDRARDFATWLRSEVGGTRRHEMGSSAEPTLAWLDAVGDEVGRT